MSIIGQTKLLKNINRLVEDSNMPRYIIISGSVGSGKKLISAYIAKKLNALFVPCEIGVDDVRQVIDISYQLTEPTVYMFADSNKMSVAAKNAVLKITEEPPQNAYFIMTTDNTDNLLNTLISRGYLFNMMPYTFNELLEFANNKYTDRSKEEISLIANLSNVPGDVISLAEKDIKQIDKISTILCTQIGKVNLANLLKISTFLKFKEADEDKIDLNLFVKACKLKLADILLNDYNPLYSDLIGITSRYSADLDTKSLNKQSVVDNWLIDMHLKAVGGV